MISKHTKPNQSSPKGGILRQEAPIDSSNVMYVHKGTVTRIGFKTVEGKKGPKKVRIAKSTGEVID
jgi:large subunit ribosomal protein L24